jgi:hypothetical protein
MTVEIVVCLSADTRGKEYFAYLDDELGRREYDALAGAFRAIDRCRPKRNFTN